MKTYNEGRMACLNEIHIDDNPFKFGEHCGKWLQWRMGWIYQLRHEWEMLR